MSARRQAWFIGGGGQAGKTTLRCHLTPGRMGALWKQITTKSVTGMAQWRSSFELCILTLRQQAQRETEPGLGFGNHKAPPPDPPQWHISSNEVTLPNLCNPVQEFYSVMNKHTNKWACGSTLGQTTKSTISTRYAFRYLWKILSVNKRKHEICLFETDLSLSGCLQL